MSKEDKICEDCFEERKKSASNYYEEKVSAFKIGKAALPFLILAPLPTLLANKLINRFKYGSSGKIYHVYIDGNHEKWTFYKVDKSNLIKCCKCQNFENNYFHLYSKE